jgi:hypothetical protein
MVEFAVLLSTLFGHLKDSPIFVWALFVKQSDDSRITRFNHRRLGVLKALAKQGYKSRIVDFTHSISSIQIQYYFQSG